MLLGLIFGSTLGLVTLVFLPLFIEVGKCDFIINKNKKIGFYLIFLQV
jgi:hypothetical protein